MFASNLLQVAASHTALMAARADASDADAIAIKKALEKGWAPLEKRMKMREGTKIMRGGVSPI